MDVLVLGPESPGIDFEKGVLDRLPSEMKNVHMRYVKLLTLRSFEIFSMAHSTYVVVILESASERELCL